LESLINQTYTHTEIVVVNDGSTDSCLQIIKEFADRDKRIKIIDKPNGGLPSARNAGVAVATGEYVWHVDSDDYAELDSLGKMVAVAVRDNSDIVVTGYKSIPNPEKPDDYIYAGPRFSGIISGTEALRRMLCFRIGGDPWAKLYKRNLYTENSVVQNEAFYIAEDTLLNYQLFAKAKMVSSLNSITINHIYREGSVFSKSQQLNPQKRANIHFGYMSMANYGFPTEDVKNAYYGYVGLDFLNCFRQHDMKLLKALDATGIRKIYQYLSYLVCYDKIGAGWTPKMKFAFKFLRYRLARVIAACFLKLFSLTFK
jgi:glycosyltransferase involved in cell wall biosynthesis